MSKQFVKWICVEFLFEKVMIHLSKDNLEEVVSTIYEKIRR